MYHVIKSLERSPAIELYGNKLLITARTYQTGVQLEELRKAQGISNAIPLAHLDSR
jgi:hypothetical protein